MKKVLIFGASGFVGYYLANELLANNYKIIGCDIVTNTLLNKSIKQYCCDLNNYDEIIKILKIENPDIVVNLAAISSVGQSWKNPQKTILINVLGSLNILEAIKNTKKDTKILLVGSSEEYVKSDDKISESSLLNATNPYGISKITQEQFARLYRDQFNMNVSCVRAFNHTGIGQKECFVLSDWCKQIAEIEKSHKSGIIKVGNLSVKRDFCDVRDVVEAYRMIIESDATDFVFNIGSGNAYSLNDLLNYIIGLSAQHIEIEIDETKIRPVDQNVVCCDRSLIYEKIGWYPKHDLYDTLKEMFDFFLVSK